jgi:uncharacterized damage-inducible protein DinB
MLSTSRRRDDLRENAPRSGRTTPIAGPPEQSMSSSALEVKLLDLNRDSRGTVLRSTFHQPTHGVNRPMRIRSIAVLAIAIGVAPRNAGAQSHTALTPLADTTEMARERANFRLMLTGSVRRNIVEAAEAMPADKFGFAPTVGEFANVRTFGREIKHLAATNYILAAAALGQSAPADAGDEEGPDSVITKAQHVAYLERSFDVLAKAIDAIGDARIPVKSSPISPFQGGTATRLSLIAEALIHSYDHYGQMVVYLRMNGVVPPASRR